MSITLINIWEGETKRWFFWRRGGSQLSFKRSTKDCKILEGAFVTSIHHPMFCLRFRHVAKVNGSLESPRLDPEIIISQAQLAKISHQGQRQRPKCLKQQAGCRRVLKWATAMVVFEENCKQHLWNIHRFAMFTTIDRGQHDQHVPWLEKTWIRGMCVTLFYYPLIVVSEAVSISQVISADVPTGHVET